MCGMGAMGCVEYKDGSEKLTAGREEMLKELKIDDRVHAGDIASALDKHAGEWHSASWLPGATI